MTASRGVIHPKRPPRGRPRGSSIQFRADGDRFKITFMVFAQANFGLKPYDAAALSVLLFADEPIDVSSIEGLLTNLAVNLRQTTSVKSREERLVAKFRKFHAQSNTDDLIWLTTSASSLTVLFNTTPSDVDRLTKVHRAMTNLIALGWCDALCHLLPRIEQVLKSNLPPSNDQLSSKVQRFLSQAYSNSLKRR